jgi:hypothetical protein
LPKNGLFKTGPDDLLYHLVFFNTFEELKLPIKGPMEDAGVIKLYEPSPTPCLYVAPVENITGRVPLFPLFLAGNSTPTVPHCYSKHKDTGFPMGCADSAAVDGRRGSNVYDSVRSTHDCGSLDGASRDWVDSMWRKLLRGRRLPKMKGSSVDDRRDSVSDPGPAPARPGYQRP